jgi:hypothetical protein
MTSRASPALCRCSPTRCWRPASRQWLTLTVAGYHEAGGVPGAIAQTAERTLQNLPEADRPIARAIFLSLTDVGEGAEPTRRRVDRTELATHPESADWSERVLAILTDARLVSVEERTVVVAHEALIRHWPRLRGWIDAGRADLLTHRRLTDAAREWDTLEREPAALYRGVRLATASEWATDHANQLSQLERDFLSASEANQHNELVDKARKNEQLAALLEAARHRTHRLRVLASGLAVLIAVVAALAVWAIGQRNDAHRQATEATSLALAASTNSVFSSRPDISLLLAFEAYRASPRAAPGLDHTPPSSPVRGRRTYRARHVLVQRRAAHLSRPRGPNRASTRSRRRPTRPAALQAPPRVTCAIISDFVQRRASPDCHLHRRTIFASGPRPTNTS